MALCRSYLLSNVHRVCNKQRPNKRCTSRRRRSLLSSLLCHYYRRLQNIFTILGELLVFCQRCLLTNSFRAETSVERKVFDSKLNQMPLFFTLFRLCAHSDTILFLSTAHLQQFFFLPMLFSLFCIFSFNYS